MILKQAFQQLTAIYNPEVQLIDKLWFEIENSYSHQARYYHTLHHLEHMFSHLSHVRTNIQGWNTILFALFYHDIIYKPTSNLNEEKSAELAEVRFAEIAYPEKQIKKCKRAILATKTHIESADTDINYFTDADLCILGQSWENYLAYAKNVRKEYSIYPDFIYNRGRKKVLNHFLGMKRFFKTDFFFEKFEKKAKENLTTERNLL
jgi:predicted metal-dependent HD superfamily phosphohydrolase